MTRTNLRFLRRTLPALTLLVIGRLASATDLHVDEASFQSALAGGFTLINLDAPPLNAHNHGYRVEDAGPAGDFADFGIDFFGYDAQVFAGNAGQIAKPGRDRLITHGTGFGGQIAFELLVPAQGIGAWSNVGDGGRVRAFDGPGLSGSLIGEAPLNSGSFGGLTSTTLIKSVQITCEFNADLKCGVFDIQFGTLTPVPEPATPWMLALGLAVVAGSAGRRRR